MNTKINKSLLSSWAQGIYSDNDTAINSLSEFETLANTITSAYDSLSSQAFITNINKDIDNIIDTHSTMSNLQTFLEKVVENAEDA